MVIDDVLSFFTDTDSLSLHEQQPATLPPTRSEIFCNSQEQDKFLPDDGPDSSLLMELNPGKTINSCKRFFTAPQSSGLFIRLVRLNDSADDMGPLSTMFRGSFNNVTEYCPISIVSSRPWPCHCNVPLSESITHTRFASYFVLGLVKVITN